MVLARGCKMRANARHEGARREPSVLGIRRQQEDFPNAASLA
jgi:hypothetical protein